MQSTCVGGFNSADRGDDGEKKVCGGDELLAVASSTRLECRVTCGALSSLHGHALHSK
jgi:hypothetical protein